MPKMPGREGLPITGNISNAVQLSIVAAILMTASSVGGLFNQSLFYPTASQKQFFIANDAVNLLVGVPVLGCAIWLTCASKLIGLLSLPGALLFVLYNYIIYMFGIPFGLHTLVYFALVILSACVYVQLLTSIDSQSIHQKLSGQVPAKSSAYVLLLFGVLFVMRAIYAFARSRISQTALPMTESGLLASDMVISMFWISGGVSLLREMPIGYVKCLGLLLSGSFLFLALILVLVLKSIITGAAFNPADVIVVTFMGSLFFVPYGKFFFVVLQAEQAPV